MGKITGWTAFFQVSTPVYNGLNYYHILFKYGFFLRRMLDLVCLELIEELTTSNKVRHKENTFELFRMKKL